MADDDSDIEIQEDDELQKFLGTSTFGKQSKVDNTKKRIDQSKRGAPNSSSTKDETSIERSKELPKDKSQDDDSDEDDDSDDDGDDDDEFPVSHEMIIKTHDKAATTISVDPSGARLVSGSMDCTMKFHDFASMTPTTIRAFKSVDPTATRGSATNTETHPVNQALFNPLSAGHILVTTALPQLRIISRDGETLMETPKGDMYLRDMHNTKGHISEVSTGCWSPTDRNIFASAGTDSTVRIWDITNPRSQKEVIVHKSRAAGSAGRTRMTAVAWSNRAQGCGNFLAATALDGTLVMWDGNGPFSRPAAEVKYAHSPGTWTSGLDVSPDGRLVVTRGGDGIIKLWDVRKFKQPVNSVTHTSTSSQYPTTNIKFAPNAANIITGSETGHLHILNPGSLRPELVTPVTPNSPLICVLWHPKLNQILTGSANAEVHVLYNPDKSVGGAKTVMSRAPKKRHIDDDPNFTMDLTNGISGDSIILPGGSTPSAASFASRHPTVGLTASGKSRDPRRPNVPVQTPFAKGNPDANYVRNQIPLSSLRDEDPREALLKYADKAKQDPMFTNAWKETQPDTIYAALSDDEEEEEPDKKKTKR